METGSGGVADSIMKNLSKIPNSYWVKPTVTNKRGTQDIFGDIQGYAVWIEVKANAKRKPSPLQQYRINRANERGALSFRTHSWKDVQRRLEQFAKEKNIIL